MIASILACPKCNTLIMEDTVICPGCHHVLKPDHAPLAKKIVAASPKYDGSQEVACRECEAMNRPGQVRCWQCGAFMQEEMERIYIAMQARPAEVISSSEFVVQQDPPGIAETAAPAFAEDDDFDLADEISMYEGPSREAEDVATEIPAHESVEEQAESSEIPQLDLADEEEPEEDEELLKLAEREERESNLQSVRRKRSIPKGTFLIKGPCGDCKIRVQNYHQGKMGQCPKCQLPFVVPILPKSEPKSAKPQEAATASLPDEEIIEAGRWNELVLKKFKPKQDLLAAKGQSVDLIRRAEGLLIVWPGKKGSIGGNAKQMEQSRKEIRNFVASGQPLDKLPAARHELIPLEQLAQIRFVQPVVSEDFTGGIRLFGEGWIGLEIPAPPVAGPEVAEAAEAASAAAAAAQKFSKKKPPKPKKVKVVKPVEPPVRCLVLTLTQYRKLREWLVSATGQPECLTHPELPLENITRTWTCALSEQEFESLDHGACYQANPATPVTTVGWLCQCGAVAISEAARVSQKFGGKKPAGLAKVKCPGCEQKFGCHPLVHLTDIVAPKPAEAEPAAKADSAAPSKPEATAAAESTAATPEAAAETPTPAEEQETSKPRKGLLGLLSRRKK
ncbi:MAG: hypothetical protein KDA76_05535 [Planctomycetaceae bacterium]|nr:hypothetical protein [Planctomycetaceae bacterium]